MCEAVKKTPYKGKMESPSLSGEGTFTVEDEGMSCALLFDEAVISYEDTEAFRFENYSLHISSAGENYRFFHMGQETEWLFNEFYAAYNKRILTALRVTEAPLLTVAGICDYDGNKERAEVRVFPYCLCILPAGKNGRRYPFVFMNGLKSENYTLTVSLSTGESCTFSMLGRDFEPLERVITERVMAMREENRAFISDLCPTLPHTDTAKAARLLHEGISAPLKILPDQLKSTLISKAKNSKMSAYYDNLISLGNADELALGVKALSEEKVEELKAALLEKLNANSEKEVTLTPKQEDALKWIVWAAMPTGDEQYTIVEFAFPNEDAATYIFKTEGGFDAFLPLINRALEATDLAREMFSTAADKLSPDMRMLIARTPAAETLHDCYVGKAIHSNPEAWKKSILSLTAPKSDEPNEPAVQTAKFCGQCGAKLADGVRFCSQCGTKL